MYEDLASKLQLQGKFLAHVSNGNSQVGWLLGKKSGDDDHDSYSNDHDDDDDGYSDDDAKW